MIHTEIERMGYACGIFDRMVQLKGGDIPRLDTWGVYPLKAAEESFSRAIAAHAFDPAMDDLAAEALDAVNVLSEEERSTPLTPEEQIIFGQGYYVGLRADGIQQTASASLADRRKAKGMTQADVATTLGVSRSQVAQWEGGMKVPEKHRDKLEEILKEETK